MKTPFRRLSIAVTAVLWVAATPAFAARPDVTVPNHMRPFMLSMPAPEYPVEARARHITGSGKYEVTFHPKTGVVTHAKVFQSTGSKLLDDTAMKALSRWRARPGRFTRVRIPFTFSLAQ